MIQQLFLARSLGRGGRFCQASFSRLSGPNCITLGEDIGQSFGLHYVFRFCIRCFDSKLERSMVTRSEYRGQISDFLTPIKWEQMGETSSSISSIQPRTKHLIYFWRGAAWPSGSL